MYSVPPMHERHQQAGAASQATSYHNQNTWRNQQALNEINACRYNTVSFGFQRPQESNVSLHNGTYSHSEMSGWQRHPGSRRTVSPQQMIEVKNYSHQALMANGQNVLPHGQRENTGFPASHRVHAHRKYGTMNQDFTDRTTTTSVSCNQTTRGGTQTTATAYNMQASHNNQFRQIDARHASNPDVYISNVATSQCSMNNGDVMYLSIGQNLSASSAQQYPAGLHYGGAGSNATTFMPFVLNKVNDFKGSSSHSEANRIKMLSRTAPNGSGPRNPSPPYRASGYSVQQSVRKSQANPEKEPAPNMQVFQDDSRQCVLEQLKSHIAQVRRPPIEESSLRSLLITSTGAQNNKARTASPPDNNISKENRVPSRSGSYQVTTQRFSPPDNGNRSPRYRSDTRRLTDAPSLVQPSDCSAHTATPGTKVIAVVQPLPCENVQVCNDTDKECTSHVTKIAEWLKKQAASFPETIRRMKTKRSVRSITTTGRGSKDDSDSLDVHASPQSSGPESELDNEKGDAQKSVPSPAPQSTKSPKDQGENKEEETSCPACPNVVVLRDDDVFTEQPYKSSWLNVNEQLDDIDKEFGFPWSLTCQYYTHESDDEADIVTTADASFAPGSETPNQVLSRLSPAQTAEDAETRSPKSVNHGDTESCYSFKLDVLPPDVAKHVFEQAASLVMLNMDEDTDAGSSEAKSADEAPEPTTMEKPATHKRVHTDKKGDDSSSNGKKKTQNHIKVVDLTIDQPTEIIISDEDDDCCIVEKEIPARIPDPDVDTPAPEEICAASVQMITLESLDNPTSSESDDMAGCEQSRGKAVEENEAYLDFQAPLSDVSDPEDQSSNESLEIRKSKECKLSDADLQPVLERFAERDHTLVDAAAQPSSSQKKTVRLVLYGSAQESGSVAEPPTFLSVSVSPLKRKGCEKDVGRANKPVKQRILEKWMESLQPVTIKNKTPPAERLKTGKQPVSTKKTNVNQRDRLLKRRKVVKENPKKYAVTVKESDDRGKSEPINENLDPSAIQDNIVLKFTVLPTTFNFNDQSEAVKKPPAAHSGGCERSGKKPEPVEGELQTHNDAVNKAKVTWKMNPLTLVSPPPFPKKSDIFQEFQKKHTKKNAARKHLLPSCLFSGK